MSYLGSGRKANPNIERYTPEWIIDIVHSVMGGVDLDPASCAEANATVRATRFFDAESDGLAQPWSGRVWLNPPWQGGQVRKFADKLRAENPPEAMTLVLHCFESRWYRDLLGWQDALAIFDRPITFTGPGLTHTEKYGLRPIALGYRGPHLARFLTAAHDCGQVSTVWCQSRYA